jgi:hypothetical protein
MARKLEHDYTFTPSTNTIVLDYIYKPERILMIVNVEDNITLYQFNDPNSGFTNISYNYALEQTTIVVNKDCSAMSSSDKLQIWVENDAVTFEPSETFMDPVSKMRVSTPENLIDTDFEYGLQSQKWETLEQIKNIPTFFSRSGDESVALVNITTRVDSDIVTVTTEFDHNYSLGTPVIVIGSKSVTCDGSFVVTNVISSTVFQYKAKAIQPVTTSIIEDYTQLFTASIYQGTEFDLSGISAITTDEAANSTLSVTTVYPTRFQTGTSFYLVNSLSTANTTFDATAVVADNFDLYEETVNTDGNDDTEYPLRITGWNPYTYEPDSYFAFRQNESMSVASNTLTFPRNHGLTSGFYVYNVGIGNTNRINGLPIHDQGNTNILRIIVTSPTQIQFRNVNNNLIGISLTALTTQDGGKVRSVFARAIYVIAVQFGFPQGSFIANDYLDSQRYAVLHNSTDGNSDYWTVLQSDIRTLASTSFGLGRVQIQTSQAGASQFGTFIATGAVQNGTQRLYVLARRRTTDRSAEFTPTGFVGTNLYAPNHGFETGDIVIPSGSNNTILTNALHYQVTKVSNNSIRFSLPSGPVVPSFALSNYGHTSYAFDRFRDNASSDNIAIPNHTLADQAEVTYNRNGNTAIPGLTDSQVYYVFRGTANAVKLSSSVDGLVGTAISVRQDATGNAFGPNGYIVVNQINEALTAAGWANGDRVIYTSDFPLPGLVSGATYYVSLSSNVTINSRMYLYRNQADAAAATTANAIPIRYYGTSRGLAGTLQRTNQVDITAASTGTHILASGGGDGVYALTGRVSSREFTLSTNQEIKNRIFTLDSTNMVLDTTSPNNNGGFYVANHGLTTGTALLFETDGTPPTGLTDDTTYYVIRVSKNYFRLAASNADAQDGTKINVTALGSGNHTLTTTTISGELEARGTVSVTSGDNRVIGDGTSFGSVFNKGDTINIYVDATSRLLDPEGVDTGSNFFDQDGHGMATGTPVRCIVDTLPYVNENEIVYARSLSVDTFSIHITRAGAVANTGRISLTTDSIATSTALFETISDLGSTITKTVSFVNSNTLMTVVDNFDSTVTDTKFSINTGLLVRADGFALHRPYDGGVDLIPTTNPDGQMIRQTRKYFRYQSGKGIQVSMAINFSPSVAIETMTRVGLTATVKTRFPHRLTTGLDVTITGATDEDWNGTYSVVSITDTYNFTVTLDHEPADTSAASLLEYVVEQWSGSRTKAGMFDDQNGMYFEYDGTALSVVRRSSVRQISGTVGVTFNSGELVGVGTRFNSQLSVDEKIVIKGQTYIITEIVSDTSAFIMPSYRGTTGIGAIVSKIVDTKVPQSQWNLDTCDGTGPSGYFLDIHKIQMAYIDYSWYGAGKVRFGFKDQRGKVIYCHEFIHNNKQTESYMRSGNLPARYEIENIGNPDYVPSLAHWGTSVIMDGRFDDDKAYVFTASSNKISVTGSSALTVSGRIENLNRYFILYEGRYRLGGWAILIETGSTSFNNITANLSVSGANLSPGTLTANPVDVVLQPNQPYQAGVTSFIQNVGQVTARNLLLLDRAPIGVSGGNSNYTVTLSASDTSVVYDQPLISIRLAPSVDTGTPGSLGSREIINRMQLILDSVGILSTHSVEITLKLNSSLNTNSWQRVNNPSLSELIYHQPGDTSIGGAAIYSFRAQGSTGTSGRSQFLTTETLKDIATLGNSILGGDATFPDGPDMLTIVARLVEDPSTVSSVNPFVISGRISWSESQA